MEACQCGENSHVSNNLSLANPDDFTYLQPDSTLTRGNLSGDTLIWRQCRPTVLCYIKCLWWWWVNRHPPLQDRPRCFQTRRVRQDFTEETQMFILRNCHLFLPEQELTWTGDWNNRWVPSSIELVSGPIVCFSLNWNPLQWVFC